ncbi:MAG TPA: hypothetical protein VLD38_08635 [Nitrosopumilaceae archaeon]|nr:hypothetical protein [Nitrosopumilaceae archaeon]
MYLIEPLYDTLDQIYANQFLKEFLIQLIAVSIGVLPAISLAIAAYKHLKNSDSQETKKHAIDSILEELTNIQTALNDSEFKPITWDDTKKLFVGNWVLMESDSFEGCVNSGNFTLLSPGLQNNLSRLYLGIKNNNSLYFQVLGFYTTPIYLSPEIDLVANKLAKSMNENISEIRDTIKDIIPKLETAKKYSRYL